MKRDELVDIFKKNLSKIDSAKKTHEDLIHDVVADYILLLMTRGNIPHQMLTQLEEDLKEEVLEIYRKTTYGYPSLNDYKNSRKSKAKNNRST